MTKVAPHYKKVGNILLNSPDGAEIEIIKVEHKDPHDIVYTIFQKWLTSDATASWKKLVQCLEDVRLNALAKEIKDCLH